MQVERNHIISIRYVMKNSAGDVLENTMSLDPINYLQGSSSIEHGLQAQLEGLKPGDRKKVYLLAASGLTTDDYEFDVIIDAVNIASEEEILLGYSVNTRLARCEDDCDCYHQSN